MTRDWSDVPNSNVVTVFPRSNVPRCACQEPLPGKCCGRDGHGVGHGQLPRYLLMSDRFPRCANGIRFCKEPLFGSVGALRGLHAVFRDFLLLPLVPGSPPSSGTPEPPLLHILSKAWRVKLSRLRRSGDCYTVTQSAVGSHVQ